MTPVLIARFGWTGGPEFGASVALSRNGKTGVVGEPTSAGGTAWVFTERRQTDKWNKFGLHGAGKSAGFGTSVAISADGKVVLVGAPYDNRRKKGTAWVYRKTAGGGWIGHKLRPKDEKGPSTFGYSVALSANGSTALVGGFADNKQKGAVWTFARSGSTWKQQSKKLTGEGEIGAGQFGRSVALSGDGQLALMGGPQDDENVGAAWVFARTGSTWKQQGKKLTGGKTTAKSFGWDVALSASGRDSPHRSARLWNGVSLRTLAPGGAVGRRSPAPASSATACRFLRRATLRRSARGPLPPTPPRPPKARPTSSRARASAASGPVMS